MLAHGQRGDCHLKSLIWDLAVAVEQLIRSEVAPVLGHLADQHGVLVVLAQRHCSHLQHASHALLENPSLPQL